MGLLYFAVPIKDYNALGVYLGSSYSVNPICDHISLYPCISVTFLGDLDTLGNRQDLLVYLEVPGNYLQHM